MPSTPSDEVLSLQGAQHLALSGSLKNITRWITRRFISALWRVVHRHHKPDFHKIKFIRAVRLCKTPALGGHKFMCLDCGHEVYIYHSCGHSQCPLCQSIKRQQWQERLGVKLLAVPYTHGIYNTT